MTTHLSTGRRRGAFSRFPMVLLLVGIALHAPFAQPLLTLPDVVVEAGAYDPLLSPAAGRTVISGDDLRDQGVSDVAQALEEVTGAWFQASGASGGQKALSIRGSSTNQVLVLVDGVRVADPSFTVTDFSRLGISIEDIESVTVIRGAASAQYGADAVGGVVLIATKRGADKAGFSLSAGNLSYLPNRAESLVEGQNLAFRAQVPLASGGLLVSGRLERDGGAYPYLDAANAVKYRENAALLGGSGSIAWETAAGEGTFSAGLNLAARDMGVPGTTSWATPNAHQRDGQARATLRYATDYFLSDSVSMQATGYAQHGIYEYKNPDSAEDDLHRGTQGGLDSVWSVLLGGDSAASLGLSARYDRIDSTSVKKNVGRSAGTLQPGSLCRADAEIAALVDFAGDQIRLDERFRRRHFRRPGHRVRGVRHAEGLAVGCHRLPCADLLRHVLADERLGGRQPCPEKRVRLLRRYRSCVRTRNFRSRPARRRHRVRALFQGFDHLAGGKRFYLPAHQHRRGAASGRGVRGIGVARRLEPGRHLRIPAQLHARRLGGKLCDFR